MKVLFISNLVFSRAIREMDAVSDGLGYCVGHRLQRILSSTGQENKPLVGTRGTVV